MRISVRNLVEFLYRHGDIDNRSTSRSETDAMQQGSRMHRKIQGRMKGNYQAEVPLKIEVPYDCCLLTIEGRADGIEKFFDEDGTLTGVRVDEIKSMYRDVTKIKEPFLLHLLQAKCYAYMYLVLFPMEEIEVQMTYVNLDTEEENRIRQSYSFEELENWFVQMTKEYEKWVVYLCGHRKSMIESAKQVPFPFDYRPRQKDIIKSVYWAVCEKRNLFIQAPTGVGKTLSVIYPGVKAAGQDKIDKIFYLTAKTVTARVAHDSFQMLREQGLDFKCTAITAKEKLCILEETKCNPDFCERAKGHFDRINDAVYEVITEYDDITGDVIRTCAKKHRVCPYELNLDVSSFVDAVICDYNYAFDPTVALKRYFAASNTGKYLLLADESHNLVERAREMYSASLCKEDVLYISEKISDISSKAAKALEKCNKILLAYKRMSDREYFYLEEIGDLILALERAFRALETLLEEKREFAGREEVLQFYFEVTHFLKMYDCSMLTDENKISFYETCGHFLEDGRFQVRLMCMNPSENLKNTLEQAVSTVFFSATLLPVNYYKRLLSGNTEDYAIYIPSPFRREYRKILIAEDVSSKYTRRNQIEYQKMAAYIEKICGARKGNYMIFCPSYSYMEKIATRIQGDYETALQEKSMDEESRQEFLALFEQEHQKTFLCFCVMGGLFSEGIDLTGERLIGAIVIGTGLPQVCMEKEVTKRYFDKTGMNGFSYAYLYPGMNKVLQAAGRVIRTEKDKGIIALLDERFLKKEYRNLFPVEWEDCERMCLGDAGQMAEKFWETL